jgi:hypothetical protein
METLLIKKVQGRVFGVEVSEMRPTETLANGAQGFAGPVKLYRDGAQVGTGRWDSEGLADCQDLGGRPLDLFPDGDEGDAYRALAVEVRAHFARQSDRSA